METKTKGLKSAKAKNNQKEVHEISNGQEFIQNSIELIEKSFDEDQGISCLRDLAKYQNPNIPTEVNYQEAENYKLKILLQAGGTRLKKFLELSEEIYQRMGEEYYYELLRVLIQDPQKMINEKWDLIKILSNHDTLPLMDDEEKIAFGFLPEKLKIYSGCSIPDIDVNFENFLTLNWTTDYNEAIRNSRLGPGYPVVFKTEIEKNTVLAYFTRDGESEVLCNFIDILLSDMEVESYYNPYYSS